MEYMGLNSLLGPVVFGLDVWAIASILNAHRDGSEGATMDRAGGDSCQ
jgi:hypothetical protein